MRPRNLFGICSEVGVRLEFGENSLGKRLGPAMRGTLHTKICRHKNKIHVFGDFPCPFWKKARKEDQARFALARERNLWNL